MGNMDVVTERRVEEIARSLQKFLKMESAQGSEELSDEKKREMFKAIATDPEARKEYAASRAEVVNKQLATQSTVRKIYKPVTIESTNTGFPIDWDYTPLAYIAPSIAGTPYAVFESDEIFVPPIELIAGVEFLKKYARDGRFDVGQSATEKLKNRLMAQEEFVGWRLAKATISGVTSNQTVYTAGAVGNLFDALTLSGLAQAGYQLDRNQRTLRELFMTPLRHKNILEWTTPAIDYFTQREIYKIAGPAEGRIYNVAINKVYDTTLINDGEVFGFDTNTFGVWATIKGVETYEDPSVIRERKIAILADEEIGAAAMDALAIVRIRLDND